MPDSINVTRRGEDHVHARNTTTSTEYDHAAATASRNVFRGHLFNCGDFRDWRRPGDPGFH